MHTKDLSLCVRKAIITHTLVIRTSCSYTEVAWLTQKLQKSAEKPFVTQKRGSETVVHVSNKARKRSKTIRQPQKKFKGHMG